VNPQRATQLFADDLKVGQSFAGERRRIGDAEFTAFAQMTGDAHPIHYDDAYAANTRYGKRLAHGLLVMSITALGATALSQRVEDAMIAFVEQGARFLKPVFVDDVLQSHFEVSSVVQKPGSDKALVRFEVRLVNDRGETVLEGFHVYLLRARAAAGAAGTHHG
jgi:3-hydroxybutyryl-CoA dehydratase